MKPDSTYISEISTNPEYDYYSELKATENTESSIDRPSLDDFKIGTVSREGAWLVSAVMLGIILWFAFRKLKINFVNRDDDESHGLGDDTIYGHSWDTEIADLTVRKNYDELVVLYYLKWIKTLDDRGVIEFKKSKTPKMYIQEVKEHSSDDVQKTRLLTHHYLRIRYGHKKADAKLVEQLSKL